MVNILSITDTANGNQLQAFQYDALDRLQRYEAAGGTGGTWGAQWFGYDTAGNLTAIQSGSSTGALQRTYNNNAQRSSSDCSVGYLNPAHSGGGTHRVPRQQHNALLL